MPTIAEQLTALANAKTAIANAITAKGGTVPSSFADYGTAIQALPSTVTDAPDPDLPVKLIDYDGTLLYSYSERDFYKLSALPDPPTHTGLTFQGWNYTLQDAKSEVSDRLSLVIGCNYVTSDGKTRIHLTFDDDHYTTFSLGFDQSVSGGVTVDWGDGSAVETSGSGTVVSFQHTYTVSLSSQNPTQSFTVVITPVSGTISFVCNISDRQTTDPDYFAHNSRITAVELGACGNSLEETFAGTNIEKINIPSNITAFSDTFGGCTKLKAVVIPSGTTTTGSHTFERCSSLEYVSLPQSVTSVGSYAFSGCGALRTIVMPRTLTTVGQYAFDGCVSLKFPWDPYVRECILPEMLTTIGQYAFRGCYSIDHIVMSRVTSVGRRAFDDCISLQDVDIGSNIGSIPTQLFFGCVALKIFRYASSSSLTSIGGYAFGNCYGLYAVVFPYLSSPPELDSTAFNYATGVGSLKYIVVKDQATKTAFQGASNWSAYSAKIKTFSEIT